MSFMKPEIRFGPWIEIQGPAGTEFFPAYAFEDIKPYYDGPNFEIKIIEGYGARFHASGLYLDCINWAVFKTKKEARKYLAKEKARYTHQPMKKTKKMTNKKNDND
jgi:hypothetical protein